MEAPPTVNLQPSRPDRPLAMPRYGAPPPPLDDDML